MDYSGLKRKKKRQQGRKHEGYLKHKHHFAACTPSSSITYPSAIIQSLSTANRHLSIRGKKVEVNLSQLHLHKAVKLEEALAPKEIHILNLSGSCLGSLPNCFQLDSVVCMSLHSNNISELDMVHSMKNLIELILSANQLTSFPNAKALQCLPSIKKLFLNNNTIHSVPVSSIEALATTSIEVLDLSYNRITSLPDEIGLLTSLQSFNLSDNELTELPQSILKLYRLLHPAWSFSVQRNRLISPPQQIAERNGLVSIAEHFKATSGYASAAGSKDGSPTLRPSAARRSCHLRMVVVGNDGAGKSTIVYLLGKREFTVEALEEDAPLEESSDLQLSHVPNSLTLSEPVRWQLRSYLASTDKSSVSIDNYIQFHTAIKVNIYDFVGQEMYHAVAEMFFSETTLHLLAFDLSATASGHDCDAKVQYWVDLIQARAPGSSILLVATHIDQLSSGEMEERINMVHARLTRNEELRLSDLNTELAHHIAVEENDKHHIAMLKKLISQRPIICAPIVPFAFNDANSRSLKVLVARISALASPSETTLNPFWILNIPLPEHYCNVKTVLQEHRQRSWRFCTIRQLHREVLQRFESYAMQSRRNGEELEAPTLEATENAVVYWTSVGEVVWFPSSEEEESDHDASFRWDHTGAGGSELPVVMEKGRSDSESVAPVPLTDEDELQFEDVSGKSAPLRGYAEEGDDLSQDGDQESMYDGEDQSTVLSSSAGLHSSSCYEVSVPSLSEYVFLSPTWLNRAIKGVMDRRAMEAFEADRRSGEVARSNFLNGVVHWGLVKLFLLHNPEFGEAQQLVSKDSSEEQTLQLLKEVLTRLSLIIPIDTSALSADTDAAVDGGGADSANSDMASVSTFFTSDSGNRHRLVSEDSDHMYDGSKQQTYRQTCYLLPALLAEHSLSGPSAERVTSQAQSLSAWSSNVSYAQKGWIRLERRFAFTRFVPSAIVPRIIAKMYSRFGQVLKTSAPQELGSEHSKCWRSAFIQEYGDCRVWMLFEEDKAVTQSTSQKLKSSATFISPRSRLASRDIGEEDLSGFLLGQTGEGTGRATTKSPEEQVGLVRDTSRSKSFTFDDRDVGELQEEAGEEENELLLNNSAIPQEGSAKSAYSCDTATTEDESSGRVVLLRIISYGHLLQVHSVVNALDDYTAAVQEILSEYRGVSQVFPSTLCPVCLMKQLPEEQCGLIHYADRRAVAASLEELCQGMDSLHNREDEASFIEEYRRWDRQWRLQCPANNCVIKADFLVALPERLVGSSDPDYKAEPLLSTEEQLRSLTEYVRQDVINATLSETRRIRPADLTALEPMIVHVQPVYFTNESLQRQLSLYFTGRLQASTLPKITPSNVGAPRTGTVVSYNDDTKTNSSTRKAVLTAFRVRADNRSNLAQYFLVGARNEWLYLARYSTQPMPGAALGRPISDAALIELIAPIQPIALANPNRATPTFQLRPGHQPVHSATDNLRLETSMLGGEFKAIPLNLPHLYRVPIRAIGSDQNAFEVQYRAVEPRVRARLAVEQVVQVVSLHGDRTQNSLDCHWGRIIHRDGEHYLVSAYSEQRLIGAPVLDSTGTLIGVVSSVPYKEGAHSAFYLASLNDLECC